MIKTPRIPQIPKNTDQATGRWMLGIQKAIEDAHKGVSRVSDYLSAAPIGGIVMWASPNDPPSGFFLCDGSAKSRTDYEDLYESLTVNKGTFTVTIASPGVVTLTDHGLETGDCVELTTTGALPTGLSANTNYYVIYINSSTFGLATSYANAIASTDIDTSGTQSGVHSLRYCPWGISGASNFLLPDYRGIQPEGVGQQGTSSWASANYKGGLGHYKQDQMQGHRHYWGGSSNAAGGTNAYLYINTPMAQYQSSDPISDGTNGTPRTGQTTIGPRAGVKFIIKYSQAAGVDGTDGTDGDDGEDGYDGVGFILSDSTITYDEDGNITQIDYADGQSKTITYNPDGSIDEVLWDRGFETVNKEMLYSSGDLSGVDVTVTKIGSQGRSYSIPKRQTVLTGKLDTTVYPHVPSCLAINGSNIDIKASTTEPLIIAFADGYDEWGANDYVAKITADVASAWGSFAQNQRYFLYADIDDDGVLTYGKTIIPPQYGTFNRYRHSLLHFEGTDESTTFTDEWGHTWTRSNNSKIDTDQYKFGTASMYLDGVDDDINLDFNPMGRTRWTHEIWVRPTDATLLQTIFRGYPAYSLSLAISASGYLLLYASSNGSSWNIEDGVGSGTGVGTHVFSDATWAHVAIEQHYDEENDQWYLRVYKDGVQDLSAGPYTSPIYEGGLSTDLFRIGRDSSGVNDYAGWMDEYRFTMGACRYGAAFTVPSAAFGTGDGDIHWFNIDRMEMNVGYPGSWTKKRRVFLGEVATQIGSTTIERLTIYCYQNYYRSAPIDTNTSTNYCIEHNCGIPLDAGVHAFETNAISYHTSPCAGTSEEGAAGGGRWTLGYSSANYGLCETWRHIRFYTAAANAAWDASFGTWRSDSKKTFHIMRLW